MTAWSTYSVSKPLLLLSKISIHVFHPNSAPPLRSYFLPHTTHPPTQNPLPNPRLPALHTRPHAPSPSQPKNAPYNAHPRPKSQPHIRHRFRQPQFPITILATATSFALRLPPLVLGDGRQFVPHVQRAGTSAGGETRWEIESGHVEAVELGESSG